MAPTRKKQTRPVPTPQPDWQSPRVAQPVNAITPDSKKLNVLERAQALAGPDAPPEVLAAIIIAQAADRLAENMIEAAAVGRYRG